MITSLIQVLTGRADEVYAPLAPGAAGRRNMLLLIQLRWIAVFGQALTIAIVHWGYGISLPLATLMLAPLALVVLNIISLPIVSRRPSISDFEIFMSLCIDAAALTWMLYFSGGATNPFSPLFIMQIVLAAVLLKRRYVWAFVLGSSGILALLTVFHRPMPLPEGAFSTLGLLAQGSQINFMLIAVLLAAFVSGTIRNIRARDAYLAETRQQAAEQEHIVRMGLLASGAAHELGTPLASLSVILSDWKHIQPIKDDAELREDVAMMQGEVERCKTIVTNILMAAGEARGQAPSIQRLSIFLNEIVDDWISHAGNNVSITLNGPSPLNPSIIADPALKQVLSALMDNASEAGSTEVVLDAVADHEFMILTCTDNGPGMPEHILKNLGQPYHSTKGRAGSGLGLFLLVNVMRTLGGKVEAEKLKQGGTQIRLRLPREALAPK